MTKLLVGDGGETARQELDVLTPVLYDLEDIPLKVSGVSCFGQEYRLSKVNSLPTSVSSLLSENRICKLNKVKTRVRR